MQIIKADNAPNAIGPYSQAVKSGGFVFCSGQIALDKNNNLVNGTIKDQTRQIIKNLNVILTEAGSGLGKVVKTTVYLSDMKYFKEMNEVYADYFTDFKPARATVEVSNLPKNVLIEIDCIAESE